MTMTLDPTSPGPVLTLGRVVLLVRDYDAALAFYQAAFGARVLFDAPSPSGDRYLHLGFGAEASALDGGRGGAPALGIWLLRASGADEALVGRQAGGQPLVVFYTTDVEVAVARAQAAGAALVRPVTVADGATFAHVADLYGNEFVLAEIAAGAP
jgi:predicted enzyme related to lactoylglutathione lyase